MQSSQNTTTAKRTGVRRGAQTFIAAIVLSLLTFPTNGQGAILNDLQGALLELERETAMFESFIYDLTGVQLTRIRGQVIPQAELDEIKGTAELLRSQLDTLTSEASVLIGAGFYSATAAGMELDAETLYRMSAYYLGSYFDSWGSFLIKLVYQGQATSPYDFWAPPDDEQLTTARIYRQLANIQYRLDQLEAGPAPR